MTENQTQYIKQPRKFTKRVWFTGSTALVRGQGLCYDRDYGVAADADGRRDTFVELPSGTNNMWFAGVTTAAYAAVSGGQMVEIALPGSVVEVAIGLNTVEAQTILTCAAGGPDAGIFTRPGLPGKGTARALKTVASAATGDVPIASSLDGSASIGAGDKTLTKTGLFTNAVAGDKVVVLAGATAASGAANVTPGVYTIVTRTSADVAVLDSSPCAAASAVACYVVRGNPTCLAELLGGEESGLQQTVAVKTGAETVPGAMAGGTTYVVGGVTSVATLAAGGTNGVYRKVYALVGALTTSTVAITSSAMNKATYALSATFKLAATLDYAILKWAGSRWAIVGGQGTAA